MRRIALHVIRIGVLLVSVVSPRMGQAAPPPVDAEDAALRQTYRAGVAAYNAGDFANAEKHFARVRQDNPDPAVRYYLADIYLNLGRRAEAHQMMVEFMRTLAKAPEPKAYADELGLSASLMERMYGWKALGEDPGPPAWLRPALWGVVATAGTLAVASGVGWVVTEVEYGDGPRPTFENRAEKGTARNYWINEGHRNALGVTALTAALVAAGAGVTLIVFSDEGDAIRPLVGATNSGVHFSGRF